MMATKKKEKVVYRDFDEIINDLPDGTIYPCIDDPNYGRQTSKGKIVGCVKGDGYWVGGTSINRDDSELISGNEMIVVSKLPIIEQDLISPDMTLAETRLEYDEDIEKMIKQSGKTPSKYQRAIYDEVKRGSGNVVIEARAGSGKTTTLVNALKLLPKDKKILVSAFNVKIAAELRARCPSNVDVMTLHGFGLRQLKKSLKEREMIDNDEYEESDSEYNAKSKAKGINTEFIIDAKGYYMTEYLQRALHPTLKGGVTIKESLPLERFLLKCLNLAQSYAIRPDDKDFINRMRENISSRLFKDEKEVESLEKILELTNIKEVFFTEEDRTNYGIEYGIVDYGVLMTKLMLKYALSPNKDGVKTIRRDGEYVKVPVKAMIYSFNDMIYVTAVGKNMNIDQYDYVFIDEAQDMNIAQITMLLKAGNHARIFVIGDPRQAIYLFQYSELDMMERMEKILNAKKLYLSVSYRVPKSVSRVAQKCVKDFEVPETAIEGEVNKIDASDMTSIIKPGDIVISRDNKTIKFVAKMLISKLIPIIVLGLDNYDQMIEKMIKDAIVGSKGDEGVANLIENRKQKLFGEVDDYDRAIQSKNSGRMEDTLVRYGMNKKYFYDKKGKKLEYNPVARFVYMKKAEAEAKLTDIDFVETLIYSLKTDIPSVLIEKAKELVGDYPKIDRNELRSADPTKVRMLIEGFERRRERDMEKYVVITTVHKFKGSEADRVFVLEDTFSSKCEGEYTPDTAEEDNLFYVAITRAKKQLFLVTGAFRSDDGEDE